MTSIWFPNNKYPPNTKNYLPCFVLGGGGRFSIRRKGLCQILDHLVLCSLFPSSFRCPNLHRTQPPALIPSSWSLCPSSRAAKQCLGPASEELDQAATSWALDAMPLSFGNTLQEFVDDTLMSFCGYTLLIFFVDTLWRCLKLFEDLGRELLFQLSQVPSFLLQLAYLC